MDIILEQACLVGDKEMACNAISNGANNWESGLCNACAGGHIELVKLMLANGASFITAGLTRACENNHKDIAILLLECGALAFNGLLYSNNKDMCILMIEHGAVISNCEMELDDMDISYLLNKINYFGKYKPMANLCKKRREMLMQIMQELNMRDVDTVIGQF